jgi:hypothetical protein
LNLIVTSIGDGLLVVDRDGAALLQPALHRMLGLKEDENIPKIVRATADSFIPTK